MAGRPTVKPDENLIQDYVDQGYNKSEIAKLLHVSRPTLNKLINEHGLADGVAYDILNDDEIDRHVKEAKVHLPFIGERMVIGYLKSKGYVFC